MKPCYTLAEIPSAQLKSWFLNNACFVVYLQKIHMVKSVMPGVLWKRFLYVFLVEVQTGTIILKDNMAIKFRRLRKCSHQLFQKYFSLQSVSMETLIYKDFFQEEVHYTNNLKTKNHLMVSTLRTSQINKSTLIC